MRRRLARLGFTALLGTIGGVLGTIGALAITPSGRSLLARNVSEVLTGAFRGTVEIGAVGGALLNGVTLRDVRITDEAGRHFADVPLLLADFQLPNLAGEKVGPSSFPDKVLLLEFWATWCTPCRAQARILDRLYADLASEDVEFIAVSVGEPAETVQRYVDKSPFPYPVLLDSQDQLSGHLMVYVLPTIAIVDAEGMHWP